jgi:hypothetical protein
VRTFVALLVVARLLFVAAACGGSKAASVHAVERAFLRHGQPFQSEIKPNPLLRPRDPLWPFNSARRVEPHVRGFLVASNGSTFSSEEVWVFDSAASARLAQRLVRGFGNRKATRVVHGNSTTETGFARREGNLIVTGSADRWPDVRAALADLF